MPSQYSLAAADNFDQKRALHVISAKTEKLLRVCLKVEINEIHLISKIHSYQVLFTPVTATDTCKITSM